MGDGHQGLGTLFLTVLQGQMDRGCAIFNAWLRGATCTSATPEAAERREQSRAWPGVADAALWAAVLRPRSCCHERLAPLQWGWRGSHRPAALGPSQKVCHRQALATSVSACVRLVSSLNTRSVFLTMCWTSHTSCPHTGLSPVPCSFQSAPLSVVHRSLICSSFSQARKLGTPGWPMTFPLPLLHIQCSLSLFALRVSKIHPRPHLPTSLYPASSCISLLTSEAHTQLRQLLRKSSQPQSLPYNELLAGIS